MHVLTLSFTESYCHILNNVSKNLRRLVHLLHTFNCSLARCIHMVLPVIFLSFWQILRTILGLCQYQNSTEAKYTFFILLSAFSEVLTLSLFCQQHCEDFSSARKNFICSSTTPNVAWIPSWTECSQMHSVYRETEPALKLQNHGITEWLEGNTVGHLVQPSW